MSKQFISWVLPLLFVIAIVAVVVLYNSQDESRRALYSHGLLESRDALSSKVDCNGVQYSKLKEKFLQDGYVVFRSCSLQNNPGLIEANSRYTGAINSSRITDGFRTEDSVLNLAVDPDTLEMLGYLNGRAAFPFQTLNFPVATQQPTHSDVIHFDTLPQRGLMTAAWVALEDIHPDSGPLIYYPGSHKLGLWDLDELGIRFETLSTDTSDKGANIYLKKLQEAIEYNNLKPEYGVLKKGESFIWAASLLHGGSKLNNPKLTRKSQVTHYYLVGAKKYWVPWKSIPSIDKISFKCGIPACNPAKFQTPGAPDCATRHVQRFKDRKFVDWGTTPNCN